MSTEAGNRVAPSRTCQSSGLGVTSAGGVTQTKRTTNRETIVYHFLLARLWRTSHRLWPAARRTEAIHFGASDW